VVEQAYGQGVADVFLFAIPLGLVAVIAIAFLPEQRLSTKSGIEQMEELRASQATARPRRELALSAG
jgi:hypothetical protein